MSWYNFFYQQKNKTPPQKTNKKTKTKKQKQNINEKKNRKRIIQSSVDFDDS